MHEPDLGTERCRPELGSLGRISLDLDNLWSYMKIHGDTRLGIVPVVPRPSASTSPFERCERHGLTVTVFIVGQDAALAKNAGAMRAIADAGHEIANHSFSHEPWFHTYSYDKIESEIADAETAIELATGQRPRGFRGPGFSLSDDTLRVLTERNTCTTLRPFPRSSGPLGTRVLLSSTAASSPKKSERSARSSLDPMRDGLRDLRAVPSFTLSHVDRGELVEIPVTTLPFARIPIHMSYIVYLATTLRAWPAPIFVRRWPSCEEPISSSRFCCIRSISLGKDRVTSSRSFPVCKPIPISSCGCSTRS